MEWITSTVLGLLSDFGTDYLKGLIGCLRLYKIKRDLRSRITSEILTRYGNEVYYNDFDRFLMQYNVIDNIIRNCIDESLFDYKSHSQIVDFYVKLFVENYPTYKKYHYVIRELIQRYFRVIYLSLNNINSEPVRVICNITKELSNELSSQIKDGFDLTGTKLDSLSNKADSIERKINSLITSEKSEPTEFLSNEYFSYLSLLFPSYSSEKYIGRSIYNNKEPLKKNSAIDVLLREKRVLLLGEAGMGKTFESINLLRAAIGDSRTKNIIPVLLQLHEFGTLYQNIISGIKYKINGFCEGNEDELVCEWLRSGKLLLIFDGLDDIPTDVLKERFVIEANNLISKYDNLYFFTARFNRYYDELEIHNKYYLDRIDEQTIRSELLSTGIDVEIPRHYYELFSNPFFLSVGKNVLINSNYSKCFNRSQLLNELFIELYSGRDQRKGKSIRKPLSFSEAISIIGKIAYDTFEKPSYSIMEFDALVTDSVPSNKADTVAYFISSGLFLISDRVTFVHKLLKEYCAAYYLVHAFQFEDNKQLYESYIKKDDWKEVMLFAAGLFDNLATQDNYLDLVMQDNLQLYVECVNTKSDLYMSGTIVNPQDYLLRLLSQIYRTYTYIVSHYFQTIASCFEPFESNAYGSNSGIKPGIVGALSADGRGLHFFFNTTLENNRVIISISEREFIRLRDDPTSCVDHRTIYYWVNLELSGLQGDSGRKLAIDLIKDRIKEIIDNQLLIESKYLLCEKIIISKRKIQDLKNLESLSDMLKAVDSLVDHVKLSGQTITKYNYNGVELFNLRKIISYLIEQRVDFNDFVLPEGDISPTNPGSHFIWSYYSKEQKEKRLSYFFRFHELSYLEMVKKNFPLLCNAFSRYKNAPYQMVVKIKHNDEINYNDFRSDPTIEYYYIAAENDDVPMPEIIRIDIDSSFDDYQSIINEIHTSYLKQGKKAHGFSITSSSFSTTLTSVRSGVYGPLSEHVYRSIKESLEEVFGKL